MQLKKLIEGMQYTWLKGEKDVIQEVSDIIYDSRKVVPGCAFVCISGTKLDSHDYIEEVVRKGAQVIVVEKEVAVPFEVTVIKVDSSRKALAYLSAAYFEHPAKEITMIGLTGTKGKTTTSYMIQEILRKAGKKVGLIGTIGAVIDDELIKVENTTPESYELQCLLRRMVEAGVECCIMEVSSQGIKMDRVAGINYDIGVFTNFSSDHIGPGEHESLEEYLYCKSLLFQQCKLGLINLDDAHFEGAMKDHTCTIETFGFDPKASLRANHMEYLMEPGFLGIKFDVTGIMEETFVTAIPGKFSVYNSLVAIFVCIHLHIPVSFMKEALKEIKVQGRVEIVPASDRFTMMVDYAHNAMSVESLLTTIKEYNPKRIVCVYGCGGNRSKLRRYDMGELCGKMADLSILTCDNPRDEEIQEINEDIKVGLTRSNGRYIEIEDRTAAVHYSMEHAEDGDIIILLGKGHEDYQEIKGKKYHYSEREAIMSFYK